jgi:uroporphyrinogen-III synthase
MPEAEATAERVRKMGAEPIIAPLLANIPRRFDPSLDGVQALLFTSAAGVRAFAQASPRRDVRVLAVGDETAACAREAGFADVRSADGDVTALAALARSTCKPGHGKLLHISAFHAAGNLAAALRANGLDVERRKAYSMRMARGLAPIYREKIDVILFYSGRAARVFAQYGAPNAERLVAACLSQQVADPISTAKWRKLIVSPAPREDALLKAALS